MPGAEEPHLERRDLLRRGALLGGALVWSTPVVQTIGPAAFAAGSPLGPSYVFVWFTCGSAYHLVKYDDAGQPEQCSATRQHVSGDASPTVMGRFDVIYGKYGPYEDDCPAGVTSTVNPDGRLVVNLGVSGCEIVNWFLHDGSCQQTGDDKFRWKNDGEFPQVVFTSPGATAWEFQRCAD